MRSSRISSCAASLLLTLVLALSAGVSQGLLGVCGPFTDVSDGFFCPYVLEILYLEITTGTTPTTFDPAANVTRLQMAAFLSRTVDAVARRNSRRAALNQFWSPKDVTALAVTTVRDIPQYPSSDGADVWVPNYVSGSVDRVRASDGRLLETWTGAKSATMSVPAMGKIVVTGYTLQGQLYSFDPSQPAGVVTTVASNVGSGPAALAFDGARFWTGNSGSFSIVTPASSIPWTVTTVTTGSLMSGLVFDGTNVWATDTSGVIRRLDYSGAVLQTVTTGYSPWQPVFDGVNIWVPNRGGPSLAVVRASTGAILATLTGNGLSGPLQAAFDGERVLVTNQTNDSVSVWRATDLASIGNVDTGAGSRPIGACSDGTNFWVTLITNKLVRF